MNAAAGCSVSDGNKTVYMRPIDLAGNVSDSVSDGIYLDRTASTVTGLTASVSDTNVQLTWNASSDNSRPR